jgi:cytochrome c biogenesis protein CcdA
MITLVLIGLVGGLITGISPCILPVLPVIFLSGGAQGARNASPAMPAGERRDGRRPYLVVAGLTLSFSVFTLAGTLLLDALPLPQDIIRWAGLVVLVLLGLGMMIPRVEALLEKPFSRIPRRGVGSDRSGFVLGLALGAVYVPCAGPVLAAITVAGATGRIGGGTLVLTLAFAVGTAIPLLMFALAGRGIAERLRAFRSHQRGIRVGAGAVVIALAVALTFNVTDAVQRAIPDYTTSLNNALDSPHSATKALGSRTHPSPPARRTRAREACETAEPPPRSRASSSG